MNHKGSHEGALVTTQHQLALDIFSSLGLAEVPITDTGRDFNLRKSHLLVDVSDLGLLARKVLNGVYFVAQAAPDAVVHQVELRYFKWLINYGTSNNNAHLKKVITEAQKSSVQVNVIDAANPDEDNWVSVPMLGPAGIKRGQLSFKIPVELHSQLRDPERWSLLSMRILAGFTSQYALELYERLSIYKDQEQTPLWSLDEFRSMIRVDGLKIASDFRYFKRDIIMPAVDQINEISDIEVELVPKRTGRFITHLLFKVKPSDKHLLHAKIATSKELFDVLTGEFGLSDAELDEISSNRDTWTDARLQAAIDFTKHRMKTTQVQYPGKYLMNAIKTGCRVGSVEAEAHQAKEKAQKAAKARAEKAQAALDLARKGEPVKEVPLPEGDALVDAWKRFLASPAGKLVKPKPTSYEEADSRAQGAFRAYLASK